MEHMALCIVLSSLAASVGAVAAEPQAPPFQNGDRVCFVGDSITHCGFYQWYVQQFYYTRFPQRDIQFFNCGHAGGQACDCLGRVSWDVLAKSPNVATVMFGMNDMHRWGKTPPATREEAQRLFAEHIADVQVDYEKLLDQLAENNVHLTLFGPSISDDTVESPQPATPFHNLALQLWTEKLREIAARRKAGFVDVVTLMGEVNSRMQAKDPKATLTCADRTHPGRVGSLVMAYTILMAQGMGPNVSRIAVDSQTGQAEELLNSTVQQIQRRGDGIEFVCKESALPFVVTSDAAAALDLVPLTDDLNREMLRVSNLSTGEYELRIDGEPCGIFSASALQQGVNLAIMEKTPQYRQALAVAEACKECCQYEGSLIRGKAHVRHGILDPAGVNPDDPAAVEKHLREIIRTKPEGAFDRFQSEMYLKDIAGKWGEVQKHYAELKTRIRELCVTKPHRFSLT